MCFAILKVSYRNSASPVWVEVENESDIEAKIKEVQARAEVVSIKRFHLHTSYNLVPVWQEMSSESSNQGSISAMSAVPSEVPTSVGPEEGQEISVRPVQTDGEGDTKTSRIHEEWEVGTL